MSDKELTAEQIKELKRAALPTIEQQKAAVEEIEMLIGKGVDPKTALESVFGERNSGKC